jgi:hypothetical protein
MVIMVVAMSFWWFIEIPTLIRTLNLKLTIFELHTNTQLPTFIPQTTLDGTYRQNGGQ